MSKLKRTLSIFKSLKNELNFQSKFRVLNYCFIIFLASAFDLLSVLLAVPFTSFLINNEFNDKFSNFLNIFLPNLIDNDRPINFLIFYALVICLSSIFKILNLYVRSLVTPYLGYQVAKKAYKVVLNQDLNFYINIESSEYINVFGRNLDALIYFINTFFSAFSSFINIVFILSALLIVDTKLSLYSFFIFGIIYYFIGYFFNNQIENNGNLIKNYENASTKTLQESIGNIRDILLHNRQSFFINDFMKFEKPSKLLTYKNNFLGNAPKPILEGLALLALVFISLISYVNNNNFIPVVASLALGVQKILPAMQELFACWVGLLSFSSRVSTVSDLLNQEIKVQKKDLIKYEIKGCIELTSISFRYQNTKNYVLRDISLKIDKGHKVGFIGSTGSGKSTLIDILMGLQKPSKGKLLINNQDINHSRNRHLLSSWKNSISLVPQSIFIPNLSILENIAFCIKPEQIDIDLVKKSSKIACLENLIDTNGISYKVGEYGKKISGGQRQRIAIARAIYFNSDFFVFDEATSALDKKTEREVIRNIISYKPYATIIIISHRLSILESLDKLFLLKNGILIASGKPDEVLKIYKDINRLN